MNNMKHLLLYLLFSVLIISCTQTYMSKNQAKNEVNKKGFRDGRWVDYFDEHLARLTDTSNYMSYTLSEYVDGKPINSYRTFSKNDSLIEEGSFLSDSTYYDKNTIPFRFKGVSKYYSSGRIIKEDFFDERGFCIKEINLFKNGDSIVKYLTYFKEFSPKSILLKSKVLNLKFNFSEDSSVKNPTKLFLDQYHKMYSNLKKENTSKIEFENFCNKEYFDIANWEYSMQHLNSIEKLNKAGDVTSTIDYKKFVQQVYSAIREEGRSNSNQSNDYENTTSVRNVSCTELSDNPEKYIGKSIHVSLGYMSSLNDLRTLRSGEWRDEEKLLSIKFGYANSSENEKFNTRQMDCSSGHNIFIRIPINIHHNLPNMTNGYVSITGTLIDENTILVSSVSR